MPSVLPVRRSLDVHPNGSLRLNNDYAARFIRYSGNGNAIFLVGNRNVEGILKHPPTNLSTATPYSVRINHISPEGGISFELLNPPAPAPAATPPVAPTAAAGSPGPTLSVPPAISPPFPPPPPVRVIPEETSGLGDSLLEDNFPGAIVSATTVDWIGADGTDRDVAITVSGAKALLGRMFLPAGVAVGQRRPINVISLGCFEIDRATRDIYIRAEYLEAAKWLHQQVMAQLVEEKSSPFSVKASLDLTLPAVIARKVLPFEIADLPIPCGFLRVPVPILLPTSLPEFAASDAKTGKLTGHLRLEGMGRKTTFPEFLALFYLQGGFSIELKEAKKEAIVGPAHAATATDSFQFSLRDLGSTREIKDVTITHPLTGKRIICRKACIVWDKSYTAPDEVALVDSGVTESGMPIYIDARYIPAVNKLLAKTNQPYSFEFNAHIHSGGIYSISSNAGPNLILAQVDDKFIILSSSQLIALIYTKIYEDLRGGKYEAVLRQCQGSSMAYVHANCSRISFPALSSQAEIAQLIAHFVTGDRSFVPIDPVIS